MKKTEVTFNRVHISPEAYQKIMFFVDECDKEISGMGKVVVKDGAYWITDAFLLEQEVTAASTDIDAESLAKLMSEHIREEGHLNFWWHSHVNMSAFWSGTDKATIKDIGGAGFCLATVFNKKRDTRTAFYQGGDDFLPAIWVDDIQLCIGSQPDEAKEIEWKAEMKAKVRLPKPIVHQSSTTKKKNGGQIGMEGIVASTIKTVVCTHFDQLSGNWMTKNSLKKLNKKRIAAANKALTKRIAKVNTQKLLKPWEEVNYAEREVWVELYSQWYGIEVSPWGQDLADLYNEWGHFPVKTLLTGAAV